MNDNRDFWIELAAAVLLAAIGYVLIVFIMAQGGPH